MADIATIDEAIEENGIIINEGGTSENNWYCVFKNGVIARYDKLKGIVEEVNEQRETEYVLTILGNS
jgi:hypothetical protein